MRLLLSAVLTPMLASCVSAIPVVRDVDMAISGAMGGHLYPPASFGDPDLSGVVFEYAPPQNVGRDCALYGDARDLIVAECVLTKSDGSIFVILPDPDMVSSYYFNTAKRHALGHVWQARRGQPMDHKGWGRFQ
jgi:hypothetical protein